MDLALRITDYNSAVITAYLEPALAKRTSLFDEKHEVAFRLFNGFVEGYPQLVVDLYAQTLVIHDYTKAPLGHPQVVAEAVDFYKLELPWIKSAIVKIRHSETPEGRNGTLLLGKKRNHWIREHGVRYSVDLLMNRDASFYLDTRLLRQWLIENSAGKHVLNTFAYTSSLGVAAEAGGAAAVLHTDLNQNFLNVAKVSYTLNAFPLNKKRFQSGDFWVHMQRLKRAGDVFDLVILDPPFFSDTSKGTVDMAKNTTKLINKVRPLVADGGRIVAINNSLFYSGTDYMQALESLTSGGYVEIEQTIDVGDDFVASDAIQWITDPAPFNHSTKIAILKIRHNP